ncbi:related to tRNA isopentenyltransferase [Cephalotrichum gorgonifer]|uniref:tRNA dimethylallyltransferase n=1 Tax=Cephalotrichum gorgonifer TaxID=2041049 RepID=A0AAE8N784_9PEZI|nr:related to tRNA isopentenyltransferase [Cephalotrichum gorgonifer]
MTTPKLSPPSRPLVVVLGSTGTGKSDLAVELATRFHGEVINADAMQMYHGLPIITNKMPVSERRDIPHHLLSHIPLHKETWVVEDFKREAGSLIDEIRGRGKLPIVVGGTHYYVNALLFEDRLVGKAEDPSVEFPILEESAEVMLEKLREVDPVMAERWHPNDTRKIRRSLEIYLRTGQRASDIYAQQRQKGSPTGGAPEEPADVTGKGSGPWETLVFWVYSDSEVLKARLDARVDKMLEAGLMDEVQDLYKYLKAQRASGADVDLTRGIWQSIGFKEFQRYLEAADESTPSPQPDTPLADLKAAAVENVKTATRHYAKYQSRWIKRKVLPVLAEEHPDASKHLFLLDGTNVSDWSRTVADPAAEVTATFLKGAELPAPETLSEAAAEVLRVTEAEEEVPCRKVCEICGITVLFESRWKEHLTSYRHRRNLKKQKKLALVPVPGPGDETESPAGETDVTKKSSRSSIPDLSLMD